MEDQRPAGFGVLTAIPHNILVAVAAWVVIGDGIFWGMALDAFGIVWWQCVAVSAILVGVLFWLTLSRTISITLTVLIGILFAAGTYKISRLVAFSVLVALETAIMHFCTFRILGPSVQRVLDRIRRATR